MADARAADGMLAHMRYELGENPLTLTALLIFISGYVPSIPALLILAPLVALTAAAPYSEGPARLRRFGRL